MNAILKAYTLSECMEVMAEYAAAYEEEGDNNLIFCEDRLTLLAEKALLNKTGGTFLSSVSTFARFLKTDERTLSKQGSVMAVGEVMTRLQRDNVLQCFTTASGIGNNAKCIYETLAQFSASEITPEMLRKGLTQLPEDTLKKKIQDLAAIYEGYAEFLRENAFLDESSYLGLLPEYIKKAEGMKNTNVFFLCYSSFTAQATKAIRAALESAKNVIGVFCGGEEEIYTNRAVQTFRKVCEGYGKVQEWDKGTPLEGAAESLRKALFNPEFTSKERIKTDKIHIFEAEDKIAETQYVAMKIRRALAENPDLRYRDITVLAPDVAAYSLPLKKALGEYGIPYFIDEKKSLKRHPLSRFILDCFRAVKERFSPSATQSLAQNYFFGESDEYRNYLLKYANYRGGAKRAIKTNEKIEAAFDIAYLIDCRNRVLKATENLKPKGHGRGYCHAVRKILEDFNAEERLNTLTISMEDLAQKGYLSQIYRALENVLSVAEMLTANKVMTIAEFAAILEDGLDATEISLIPLKADAVFVGDITDSRVEKAKLIFALGMTDDVPRYGSDTAIVSDKDITRLEEVKMCLEPMVAEVNLRHRESACLNLCAFTDTLYLSYPLSADGNEPALSEVFRYIDRAFCSETGGKLPRVKKAEADDFQYKCSAAAPAIRQLLISKSEYERRREDTRRQYSSLYTALDKLSVQEKDDYLMEREGQVCVERGEELFFRDGKISPTALERYFSCPFRHFVEQGLRLKEREEAVVLAVDSGNFVHELLEKTTKKAEIIETEEEMREYAMEIGQKLLEKSTYAVAQDTASGTYFFERLLKEGVDVAAAVYRQIKNSVFRVEETEKNVYGKEFRGKVDRVDGTDAYVRIIDYKTGRIDETASSYYMGKKIQMQLYMSELKGERIPAGVFYFPASVDYGEEEGRFRMRGFLNGDQEALKCGDIHITEDKPSEYFNAALVNSARSTRIMDEQTFRDFLDYSVHVARQGCQELREGFIAASPCVGDCDYCKYGGMCGFNKDVGTVRGETGISPSAIAAIAREKRGE